MERQKLMLKRVENLRDMKDNLSSVQERIKNLDSQRLELKKQGEQLDQLRTNLALTAPSGAKPAAETRPAVAG
jgi:small-conductance mechanosensitive channel